MLKKILLACSLLGPAIGFSNFGTASQWGVGVPLGAVCLIVFFILTLLESEMALYDAEEKLKSTDIKQFTTLKPFVSGIWQAS